MNKASIAAKSIIVVFWMIIIGFFLYSPKIIEIFSKSQKELNLITFTGIVSPRTVREFTLKTGIKVNVTNFESNEELLAKLKISRGKGYDLLVASDYTVDLLIKDNLVQQLDHDKISNYEFLDKRVLNKYFDHENRYSIPLSWAIYGIGYSKKFFGELQNVGWKMIFQDTKLTGHAYRICMQDDPREAIYFAGLFLFGKPGDITDERLRNVKELLLKQKAWVDVYSSNRQEYFLLSGTVPLAVIPSEYMIRVLRESKDFGFAIPKEGSLMSIENIMISASSERSESAHKFIDYLLDKEVVARGSSKYGYYPVNVDSVPLLDEELFGEFLNLTDEKFKKIGILKIGLPRRKIEDLWLLIKAS